MWFGWLGMKQVVGKALPRDQSVIISIYEIQGNPGLDY
jgi:hypothetical protein